MTKFKLSDMTSQELLAVTERMTYLRRNLLQITQERFAKALNISQTYLSQLENGNRTITETVFDQLVSVFLINPDWLLSGEGDVFKPGSDMDTEKILLLQQEKALSDVQAAYSLNADDITLIRWYLSLSPQNREIAFKNLKMLKENLYTL